MLDRPAHPAAAVFPMLPEDELADLAEDIKANGLLHPIKLDQEGRIVDGRNRNAACGLAGVEPTYETLPKGADIVAYVRTENRRRRHMSQGQLAMADALLLDVDGGRYNGARAATLDSKVSEGRISQAVTIRKYAPDLVAGVLVGTEPFDKTYDVARARKREQDEARDAKERKTRADEIELERLRRAAPDLAARVPDTLTVDEAKAAYDQRKQRERDRKEATTRLAESAFSFLDPGLAATSDERASQIAETLDASVIPTRPDLSSARAYRCLEAFKALCELIREKEKHDGRSPTA